MGYWLKQLLLLVHRVTLALADPFQTPTISESQTEHARAVSVLGMMQEKDTNFVTQNLDESIEGVGFINCFDAATTLWQEADWF